MVFCHQGQSSHAAGTVSELDKSLSVTLDLIAVILTIASFFPSSSF